MVEYIIIGFIAATLVAITVFIRMRKKDEKY